MLELSKPSLGSPTFPFESNVILLRHTTNNVVVYDGSVGRCCLLVIKAMMMNSPDDFQQALMVRFTVVVRLYQGRAFQLIKKMCEARERKFEKS